MKKILIVILLFGLLLGCLNETKTNNKQKVGGIERIDYYHTKYGGNRMIYVKIFTAKTCEDLSKIHSDAYFTNRMEDISYNLKRATEGQLEYSLERMREMKCCS